MSSERSRRFRRHRRAVVIGRWADDTALVRPEAGPAIELPVPVELRDAVDVGAAVLLDPADDRLVGVEPVRTG